MPITPITDHTQEAIDNMPSALSAAEILDMLRVVCQGLQAVETDLLALVADRTLETAAGVQLDQYGALVGAGRRGMVDDDYRKFVKVRIKANRSNGVADEILGIVSILAGDVQVNFWGLYPASYLLDFDFDDPLVPDLIQVLSEILEDTTGAGIGFDVVSGPTNSKRFDTADRGFDKGLFGASIVSSS